MISSDIDSNIKIRKIEDLYDSPVYVYVNKFDEAAVKVFAGEVQRAESNKQPIIPVLIDSYGGQVYALLAMVDILKKAKKPIATIVMGKAMSCGAFLASCGDDGMRFVSPNATIMIHDVSTWAVGKIEEVKASAGEAERLNTLAYHMMAKNCGQNLSYFLDIVHEKGHADWYLTAEDAVTHKLANHIRVPEFKVKVALDVQFK
jgi:ATP-dependent Clp protease protease subunit